METNKKPSRNYRSHSYKTKLVLKLLRGEPKEHVAREEGLTVAELTTWESQFIEGGKHSLKSASSKNPLEGELRSAHALIAEQALELALYKKKKS